MKLRLLLLVPVTICILAPGWSLGQELSRDARWVADLDYMIERLEVTHPNLYANISREEFLAHVDELKRRVPAASDIEMVFGMQELVARIENAHTLVRPIPFTSEIEELSIQFQYYPVAYHPFEDGLYVLAATERHEAIVGKKVVKIGSLTTDEAMRELARFIAADNSVTALASIPRWCLDDGQLLRHIGASDSAERITLGLEKDDGSTFEYALEMQADSEDSPPGVVSMLAEAENPTPLYLTHPRDNYWFEHLPDQNALYLQINLLYNNDAEPFADFCRRMFDAFDTAGAQKLIIDVRRCPGGDNIDMPLLKGILARPHIDRSDRLFLIIGRRTGSAAQHLTSEIESYTNATLIGEPTASKPNQYGNMQNFRLPHSQLEISCALDFFQDAKPADYSVFSAPDIFVRRTATDFRENRDPVMEVIVDYDSYEQARSEFKARISTAYSEGGMAGLKKAYGAVRADYAQMGFNMEVLLYDDLDSWMAENKKSLDDYVEYLKFIRSELPDSLPVSYDLAYWMNERGNTQEAKRLYRKCLDLNPEHHHARWRLGLIELEEKWR
jgi:tetratricopeptide (TPR) repeat protein